MPETDLILGTTVLEAKSACHLHTKKEAYLTNNVVPLFFIGLNTSDGFLLSFWNKIFSRRIN